MADGFDDNDLRLLARRAAAVKEALRALNQPPPFKEERLVAYLTLLEASTEPTDGRLVLAAVRQARQAVRDAYQENLGTEKEPEASAVDTALSALVGDLQEILLPHGLTIPTEEEGDEIVDAQDKQAELEPLREAERWVRRATQALVKELSETPIAALGGVAALTSMVNPLVATGFAALFVDAVLFDGRLAWRRIVGLLEDQEGEISAFEQAVERNRQAVESVAGLYNRTKELVATARSKITTVRRGVARIFGKAESPPKQSAFPEPRSGLRDLPPENPPTPDLPPPDCTTEDGRLGYLLAGACYPWDISRLDLRGVKNLEFEKLQNFRELKWLSLVDTNFDDIKAIDNLRKMERLFLNNTKINDLDGVQNLNLLRELWINGAAVHDISLLSNLKHLARIRINNTNIADLSPIKFNLNLESFGCNSTKIDNIAPISNMHLLKSLYFNNTRVDNIYPIKNCRNVRRIGMRSTLVRDLSPIRDLTLIESLYCSNNHIDNIEPLSGLQTLKDVRLNNTYVSNLSPISGIERLQVLDINNTPVSDLRPIKNLSNLCYVRLPNNNTIGGWSKSENARREVQEFLATL